jgi:hypothetical protein
MLDQNEGHAAISRHLREKRPEGVKTAGGRTDAYDQMASAFRPVVDRAAPRRDLCD